MNRASKLAAAALGLALLSGCGTSGGPMIGGVAAEVEDRTYTLDDVDTLTDALCASWVAGESYNNTNPRSVIQREVVARLIETGLVDELGLTEDTEPAVMKEQIPGWEDLRAAEQDALWEFLEADARRVGALQQLAGQATSQEEAEANVKDELTRLIADRGIDITVNPRYGIEVTEGGIDDTAGLSVAVSDFASAEVDLERLQALPKDQVCGPLPPASGPIGG